MAPDSFAGADGSPQQSSSSNSNLSQQDDSLDRQLLRHLMRRYGRDGVAQLMDEEAGSSSMSINNDRASVITSSTGYSSVKSESAPSIFDGASIRTFSSDTSSVTGSIISNVSARTAKFLSRKSQSGPASVSKTAAQADDGAEPATASTNAPKNKGSFTCGFCREEDIQKTCTRKNDLKRHIEDFHNMNAQWYCRHRGCRMVFDWQTAYKTHLKQAHGGSRMSLDEAKVNLCPQSVFACGFENCIQVFEASSDEEAETVFKEFVSHVVKHFDEGSSSGEWTYSARMRNLLRQTGVIGAWTNSPWPEAERNRLVWHPQSSGILRKRLETRHLGDIALLIQYAIALGSEPSTIKQYREDFIIPVKDECQESIQGHKTRPRLPPAAPEPDPYEFRISRGNDPVLAAYLASQRRVYVNHPGPVRAGRSARPPRRTMTSNAQPPNTIPAQYRFSGTPASPMFDPRQQQQYAMMSPAGGGGIIAEDLRSLRSMASNAPEQDIEMGDAQMVENPYAQQQSFSGSYIPPGIPSSSSDGPCLTPPTTMDHTMPFSAYDSHAY